MPYLYQWYGFLEEFWIRFENTVRYEMKYVLVVTIVKRYLLFNP